ncbi:hypothetical protein CRG98_043755 [Punica granatum]|uniref:Uncharacterized protein n=1 Tax=Punica granatum TaxID=22663 RepID=A0A2I0HX67_PUNGR|nr:hypothetical protein CRG98_043755 [Punica granatum]
MDSSPSITIVSPKHELPTNHSIMEEVKRNRPRPHKLSSAAIALPSNFQKLVAELVGTYVLIFAGCGAALVNQIQSLTIVGIGLVWGLVLMVMIYAVGHISGGHFNPAVTISLAASRQLSWKLFLGAMGASLTLRALFHGPDSNIKAMATQYKDTTTDLEAIAWEFIITFFLVFTICGVATDPRASKGSSGAAIGGTVMFNVMIAGPITGASMNPARSVGPAIVSGEYKNLWVFMVSPVVGGLAAALVYGILREPQTERDDETTNQCYQNRTG